MTSLCVKCGGHWHGDSAECPFCAWAAGQRITVTHDGPLVFTPALGEVIANGRAYQTGWDDGIREGERRMLWGIVVGAEWWMQLDRPRLWEIDRLYARMAQRRALVALRDLGDEDASRVLGERGW